MKETDAKVWERLPNETVKAFNAFQTYLHMPVIDPADSSNNRTLVNASRLLGYSQKNPKKPPTSIEAWSSKFSWIERGKAYDSYMARRSIVVVEESLVGYQQGVIENSTLQIAAMQRVINQKIEAMLDAQADGVDVDSLSIVRVATATRMIDDLARRVGKMPTSYKVEKVEELDDSIQTFIIGASDE